VEQIDTSGTKEGVSESQFEEFYTILKTKILGSCLGASITLRKFTSSEKM